MKIVCAAVLISKITAVVKAEIEVGPVLNTTATLIRCEFRASNLAWKTCPPA